MRTKTKQSATATVFPVHDISLRPGQESAPQLLVQTIDNASAFETPHRHAFTQLILVKAGSGLHYIDFEPRSLHPNELYVLAPGQIHAWQAQHGLECTTVLFSEEILSPLGPLPEDLRRLLLIGAEPLRPAAADLSRITRLFDAINEAPSEDVSRHLLAALLHEVVRLQRPASPVEASPGSGLTQDFMRQVLRQPNARITVTQCANELGVTAGHLTEQVVFDTGATPGRILRSAVVREAKRLLAGSELTAAQISTKLGFNEPSYFSRFFRRETGCTPSAYRGSGPSLELHSRKERYAG